ncbi:Xylose isomerase [Armadillidium vulgare]|nr:Xylose isomerase [Armadillidium vulgare]
MSSPTKKARNNPTEEEYFPRLDPFGEATITRPWDDGSQSLSNAKRRIRAAFEFFSKLGVKYWTFHDRDIAPEGETLAETNKNLDEVVTLIEELQKKTGIKLLWATYMNGAATSSNAHVTAYAGAQLKKGLEIAKRLGAENFVFWGGREGYQSLLNADVKSELDHLAAFFKMAVAFKKKIGFKGVFLIEPKAKEPTRHQYDFDAQTVMAFLHNYDLFDEFKLNIEPNHTMLAGSIDANTGSPDLGWDTDQFPMDVRNTTLVMKAVIEQGGIAPGGLNFDAKVRRESTALEDMFIAHIGAMDTFARGLQNASQLITDGILKKALQQRYKSWSSGIGSKIASGEATLEDCESYIKKHGNPTPESARQEHFESVLNFYV